MHSSKSLKVGHVARHAANGDVSSGSPKARKEASKPWTEISLCKSRKSFGIESAVRSAGTGTLTSCSPA